VAGLGHPINQQPSGLTMKRRASRGSEDATQNRRQQLPDLRQFVAQLLLDHYLQLLVDHTDVTISCTQIDSAVELHQKRPPFLVERLVKQTQFSSFAFGRLF
jgi:hypothetical protein